MKKSLLLFLAISSLSFAAASVTTGDNIQTTNIDLAKSTINVNVSAFVTGADTSLIITSDAEGKNPISAVNFEHNLTMSNNALLGEKNLSQVIYAHAPGINSSKLSHNTLNSYELNNSDSDETTTLNGNLSVEKDTQTTNNSVKYTIGSNITSTTAPLGSYETSTQALTITFNKTTNK